MPPKVAKFADGEQVLCFHGPLLYEAKCVKSEMKDKTMRYFVHYNGWNKNWDEWVPETRVLKANAEGLQRQKELKIAHSKNKSAAKAAAKSGEKDGPPSASKEKEEVMTDSATKTSKPGKTPKSGKKGEKEVEEERPSTPIVDDKKKSAAAAAAAAASEKADNLPLSELAKRKRTRQSDVNPDTPVSSTNIAPSSTEQPKKKRARVDATVESEENFLTKIEVRVKIPEELKPWLVDDWDLVCRQKQLVQLPCKVTVDNILDDYIKSKLIKPNNPHKDAIMEMTQGIREYFNIMLGTQLLYKFERPQYAEVLSKHPDLPMCQIYGATHLLRLFVKLGGMLAYTQLDQKSMQLLLNHLHDFLKYIARSANNLFSVNDYMVASPEHHRKAC